MRCAGFYLWICLGLPGVVALARENGRDLAAGWTAIRDYRAAEALEIFRAHEGDADTAMAREARLGRAVALLQKQPVSEAQIDEARALCTGLAREGSDEAALGALFFLGRIAQHHQREPDPAEAAQWFRELIARAEDSRWAQSALSRLALLELYAADPEAPPKERVARAGQWLVHAHTARAVSELHEAIADAILFYRLPAIEALPHLLVVDRLGLTEGMTRIDQVVQIAELSAAAGEREQAINYYRRFLKEFPRDPRHYIVTQKLAALTER